MLSLNASSYCIFDLENRSYTEGKLVYGKFLYIKSNERSSSSKKTWNILFNFLVLENEVDENIKSSLIS